MSFEVHSQNDDAATESRQNIRQVATECQSLFADEVINNISISTCIRRAEHRFLLWASFLGVYADEQRCLDIRLQKSPEMRNLILLMLRVLKRNLEHVIAEPYEIRNDGTKGPVYGIDGALDRLHRLATIIQSEQAISETRNVHRLKSKRISDDLGETVMTFIQKHFPDAPLSLQLQLSRSVLRRTRLLLYSRQQLRATGQSNLGDRISIMNLEAEAGSVDPLHTSNREPSASLNQRVAKLHNNTNQGVSSILQGLSLYPDPPSLDGGDEEVICELCSALLDKATIGCQEAWAKHVDRDLRPYVCISEECEQTELMFPTPTEWRFHMEAVHSIEWPRYVHQARWTCPYCQQDSVERTFTSAEEFSRHLREGNTSPHCLSVDSFELAKLTVECKRYEPIDKGDCPLCKSYVKVDGHDEVEDFYDHFIQHLRFIAFKAIDIWDAETAARLNQYASTDDAEHQPNQLSDHKYKIQIESPSPKPPNDTLSDHFRYEMGRASIRGVDGKDQVVPYVPLSALEKYWTDERVIQILKTRAIQIPEGARSIYQGYLRIFSTLVYSGFCDEISWFFHRNTSKVDDHDLPFDGSTFGYTSEWSSSFLDHQWMFCPVELTDGYCHQQALDLRVILPVTCGEYIKANRTRPDGAILRKVDFNRVGFDSYLSMGEHVIFKVYEGDKGEERYNAETDAYIRLQKLSNNSIAKYFASFYFPEVRKFVIVLEYAEGGSLADYLEANLPPTTLEDALLLWEPMFNLTEALDLLTTIYQQNPRSQSFVGIHQEINPENILVFPRGKGTSRFDVQFKFKDFGMAASGAMSTSDRRLRLGNRCNGFYVSPEVFNFAIDGSSFAAISRLADIWSLGALFSDILVWTITGTDGQDEYRLVRRAEILQIRQLSNPDYDCCFHDGEKRLKAIDEVHSEVLKCRNGDFMLPTISDIVLDFMLVEPRDRLDAMQIKRYAVRKLEEYQESEDGMFPLLNSPDIEPRYPLRQSHQTIVHADRALEPDMAYSRQHISETKIEFNMDSGPRKKFCTYVESRLVHGVNGLGETVAFVPRSALEDYWSQANVDDILDSHDQPIQESSTYIANKLRHIFSILEYTGHTQQISWFIQNVRNLSDHHLPFSAEELPPNCSWSKDFLEHQWKFCPLSFTSDTVFKRTLHSKHILPVAYEECLTDSARPSGAATLWRVHMQSECTLPLSKAGTVVFKIYEGVSAQRLYKAEAEAYRQLFDSNDEGYITKHFASFSFDDIEKSIIVLEYAEGGSLLNFLESTNLPLTLEEYCLLWSCLLNLFDALHAFNGICRSTNSNHWSLSGVHQDIQLSNILVFPKENKSSRFDVNFKLADFGLAKIGRTPSPGESLITSKKGNRMYTSPETYSNYRVQDRARIEISPACDIWSLGAVFSDVLVWSITGESGREDYRLGRQEEISNKPHLRASKHDACFHDGVSRLSAVDDFHNYVLQNKRRTDHISPHMSQLIIESMLTERLRRLNPMQAKLSADEKIKRALNGQWEELLVSPVSFTNGTWRFTSASTPTPLLQKRATLHTTTEPRPNHVPDRSLLCHSYQMEARNAVSETSVSPKPPTRHEPLTESPAPEPVSTLNNHNVPIAKAAPTNAVVAVDQVYQLLEQKDRLLPFSSSVGAKADKGGEIMDLPGMQEARSKIAEAKGRDQIMLVDNFGSMEQHKPKAMRTARVISYVAKIADDNGMKVFAASETTQKPAICTSSGKVEKAIKKMKTVKGKCDMQKCLCDILDRVLVPEQFRPTSIYIYTDGVWEPGEDGAKHSISQAINFLDRHGYNSSALMFQFIRFGNDPIGTERLDYLGNQCKRQTATDLYDIVDAKHCDEHVPDIVIGSISRGYDEKT